MKDIFKEKSFLGKVLFLLFHPSYWRKAFSIFKFRFQKIFIRPIIKFFYRFGSVDINEAIYLLTKNKDFISLYDEHKESLDSAKKVEEDCPVKMGGAGNLELLYQLAIHLGATRVIETGVAYGWSSWALLLAMKDKKDSLLISTDMPYSEETETYAGCVVPEGLRDKWKLIRKPDAEALPEALKLLHEIDMCHYDSDKSYKGRMFAYPLLWQALRPGGIFISDDIGDNLAFRKFSKQVGAKSIVVKNDKGGFAGVLVKPE